MVQLMSYFRLKYLRLPDAYMTFMQECLEPGATICIVDCALQWPTTQLADRYIFQMGALGGPTAEEYLNGGPRVAAFLEQTHATVRRWTAPKPDGLRPEAEWGFETALEIQIKDYAAHYDTMTEAKAKSLATQALDLQSQRTSLLKTYYPQFTKVLGAIDAGRLLQVEYLIMAAIDLQLASEMPLMEKPSQP